MGSVSDQEVLDYIQNHIQDFHKRRIESLASLKLRTLLKRKNPYLFKAKNINLAHDLVKTLLDAYLSSQEEAIFGSFLEGLAVFVCRKVYGGRKSSAEGIDLEFEMGGKLHLVSVKSGPNWGNSRQIAKMREDFRKAKKILGTNTRTSNVVAVNGCCYGRETSEDKGDYLKLCGQRFWALISGKESLYIDIIEPLGHQARRRNEEFLIEYGSVVNRFTKGFIEDFCNSDGQIFWERLVQFNSGVALDAHPT